MEEKEYKNKNILYNKISDKQIEIIFKNGLKQILYITNQKKPFKNIPSLKEEMNDSKLSGLKNNNKYNEKNKNKLIGIESNNSKGGINIDDNDSLIEHDKLNVKKDLNLLYNSAIKNKEHNQKIDYKKFYEYYKEFFDDLNNMKNIMAKTIDSKKVYKDYVIISKESYNKLIKLFESDSGYFNENYIIDCYEKLIPIDNIDFNNLNINIRFQKDIKNRSFFNLDWKRINDNKVKYPNNFILIKAELLKKFGFDDDEFKNNLFDILFGENYLFIQMQKKYRKNIAICSTENFFLIQI